MFNAITASESIKNTYIDYIATTFSFADRDYDRLFRNALSTSGAVAKGPYLDVSGSYETGDSLRVLMNNGVVSPLFAGLEDKPEAEKELPIERPLYLHQQKAIKQAIKGDNLVVTTGTGSGKTECFLIPMINELLREKEAGTLANSGVRALIIYPMNALANDQLKRLRKILASFKDITFGVYNGNTPEKNSKAISDYRATFDKAPLPNEILSREKMRDTPPHILITNYSMLEHTLLRPKDDIIFTGAKLRYLVLDEAHIYKGATGIETSLLIRRLLTRLHSADKVRFILTSATLGGKDSDRDIIEFMKNLCGADMTTDDIIRSREKCPEIKDKREFPSEMFARLINEEDSAAVLAEYNADFAPEGDTSEKLFELCLHSALFEQFRRITTEPITFEELYSAVSVTRAITPEQLRSFVEICAKAVKNHTALVKPRYHYFVRAIDGAFVTIGQPKQLFLDRKETDESTGQCVFEAGVCKVCGRLSLLGKDNHGKLVQCTKDYDAYTIRRAEELFDDNEPDAETGSGENDYVLCPKCGAIGSEADVKFGNSPCRCGTEYVRVTKAKVTPSGTLKCPACEFGTITSIINGADAATSVLATELFEQLPDSRIVIEKPTVSDDEDDLFSNIGNEPIIRKEMLTRQFLCFSDSRSGAAYFAPYLENSYAEMLRRRGVWKVAEELCEDGIECISVPEFVQKLKRKFLKDKSFEPEQVESNAWVAVINEMLRARTNTGLVSLGRLSFTYNDNGHNQLAENIARISGGRLSYKQSHDFFDLLIMDLVYNGSVNCGEKYNLDPDEREYLFRAKKEQYTVKQEEKGGDLYSWLPKDKDHPNNRMRRIKRDLSVVDEKFATDDGAINLLNNYWDRILVRKTIKSNLLLNACDFNIVLNSTFYKCSKCGKVTPFNVHGHCNDMRCDGTLSEYAQFDNAENHYAKLYQSSIMQPLKIKEHTAQLDKDAAAKYQEAFKDKQLNALSCSTTFEMGVDLGSLETVFMRDVPPSPANYVQRAGRAGRSLESSAFVLTFAKRSSHDYTFYADPTKMISGRIDVPKFKIVNQKIAARHIYAVAFSCFFRVADDVYGAGLDSFLKSGYKRFCEYLSSKPEELRQDLISSIPAELHELMGITDFSWTEKLIGNEGLLTIAVNDLLADLEAIEKISDAAAKKMINGTGSHSGMLTDFLVRHNILPKYGFPVDVVQLNTNTLICTEGKKLNLNRDLQLAIADYSPGSKVVADGHTYISRYIRKLPDSKGGSGWELGNKALCEKCGEITFTKLPIGGSGMNCTHCGENIPKDCWQPTLEPRLGFAAEYQKKVDMTPPVHGQKSNDFYIGDGHGRLIGKSAFEINGNTVTLESTANDSLVVLSADPYYVCPTCGRADESPLAGRNPKAHKNIYGVKCAYTRPGEKYFLSHDFKTDVVKLVFDDQSASDMSIMQSVLYALLEGMSSELGIERNDIKGCCFKMPFKGRMVYSLIVYDAAAGGAGHVRRLITGDGNVLQRVIKAALERMENCTCDTSCYFCLRNYYNQWIHDSLNRHNAAEFLRRWTGRPTPVECSENNENAHEDITETTPGTGIQEQSVSKISVTWQAALEYISPAAAEFISGITDTDAFFPGENNVGMDIADENGFVICSAEIVWNSSGRKIALLDPQYSDKKADCERLGYVVFVAGTDDKNGLESILRKETVQS